MKRANINDNNQFYPRFVIIENMVDLYDFFHEKTYGLMKDSARELVSRAQRVARGEAKDLAHIGQSDCITIGAEKVADTHGHGIIYAHALLMGTYQQQLEKYIQEGAKIAINPYNMVSFFTLTKDATYEIISEKEIYTENDIRVIRFPDGVHWYAKISNIDVVIDGEQKWNAKWVAKKKAEQFLNEMNQKSKSQELAGQKL